MYHALDKNLVANEQYSTPGKKSIDHALNRRLLFVLARYQKSSIAMTSCDLKSCYDRITHTPATLAMCRIGVPLEAIQSMFKTIQQSMVNILKLVTILNETTTRSHDGAWE